MKVGILGYGMEGQASYEYWLHKGDDVTILDANERVQLPEGARARLGKDYLADLHEFDIVVRSPIIQPELIHTTAQITTATREFFAVCPAPIIGITGTKGKGTTSTLIAQILQSTGKTVWLGGNIGRAALGFVHEIKPGDVVVLELSSFQLVDLDRSPHIGVCLMIVPEHDQWHGGMDAYANAKSAIAKFQTEQDTLVYHATNSYAGRIAGMSAGRKMPYLQTPGATIESENIMIDGNNICATSEVGLIGPHNLENICAAITATWDLVGHNVAAVATAVKNFKGLPNRLEFVRTLHDVTWINDTFSVNPSATQAALKSFSGQKVMILGGFERGLDLEPMARAVAASEVRAVIAIGETAPLIRRVLGEAGFGEVIDGGVTMPEIVHQAQLAARAGDTVILSPGCASYGLFTDYKDRGKQFVAAVLAL